MTDDDIKAANLATYGTNDSDTIRLMFKRACEEQRKRESTFGGYLRALRRRRELTETEIALKAGVSRSKWLSWEANSLAPSTQELHEVVKRLKLSPIKKEQLEALLAEAPRHTLRNLSILRLENMAARGLAAMDVELEWESLGSDVQEKLLHWASTRDLEFPRDLIASVRDLRTEDSREAWIDEVMGDNDHAH